MAEAEAAWRALVADYPDAQPATLALVGLLEESGDPARLAEAEAVLRTFVATAPTHANVLAAARKWKAWDAGADVARPAARTIRVALTGHGTLDSLGDHLRVAAALADLHVPVFVSGFDQWAQDLLAPDSDLYAFRPDLIVLVLDAAALFPRTTGDLTANAGDLAAERAAGLSRIAEALAAAQRGAPSATVLVHTFPVPDQSPLGALDLMQPDSQRARFAALNDDLAALLRERFAQRALLVDRERIEARFGKARVRDDRMWFLASLPFAEEFLPVLAREHVRIARALKGLTKKCVVLDLDNTLWGGVIGEDGFNHIKVGGTAAPGNAFAEFQRVLVTLKQRGVLLAVASKNNPEDVWPVLDGHPGMALKRSDFTALRINWTDKATNIREIAKELNIGLDSLVFLDDNPAERGRVRQELPEVLTVEMPRDPALYARTLANLDVFDTLALTDEDRNRSRLYQEQQERRAFEEAMGATAAGESTGDLTAHLYGLEMVATIAPATPFMLPRIAQLINKTNQFNVTTRRHTEAQVQAMADEPDHWGVYSISVRDRFGDSGLTGVAIVRKAPEGDPSLWEIDSFLLSCRVLGRGVEDTLMAFLANEAHAAGATRLRGIFLPTAKNAPAADLFAKQGFDRVNAAEVANAPDVSCWELRLDESGAMRAFPAWMRVEIEGDSTSR
jgi:FkbH-like protein